MKQMKTEDAEEKLAEYSVDIIGHKISNDSPEMIEKNPYPVFEELGEGGLCLSCQVCTFPNCGFGK